MFYVSSYIIVFAASRGSVFYSILTFIPRTAETETESKAKEPARTRTVNRYNAFKKSDVQLWMGVNAVSFVGACLCVNADWDLDSTLERIIDIAGLAWAVVCFFNLIFWNYKRDEFLICIKDISTFPNNIKKSFGLPFPATPLPNTQPVTTEKRPTPGKRGGETARELDRTTGQPTCVFEWSREVTSTMDGQYVTSDGKFFSSPEEKPRKHRLPDGGIRVQILWDELGLQQEQRVPAVLRGYNDWLREVIFKPLLAEIATANMLLRKDNPRNKYEIGINFPLNRHDIIAKYPLSHVIPFLIGLRDSMDQNIYQSHFLERLRALAERKSRWDVCQPGVDMQLPTDSEICMHLMCVYFNLSLYGKANAEEGKFFSELHFLGCTDYPHDEVSKRLKRSDIYIYSNTTEPSVYHILMYQTRKEDDLSKKRGGLPRLWNLDKGSNNIAQVILLLCWNALQDPHDEKMDDFDKIGLTGVALMKLTAELGPKK